MSAAMRCQLLIDATQCSNFLQIAVLLNLRTLYQSIIKSEFKEGNDLVTVLLTGVFAVLHIPNNLFQR